MKHQQSYSRIPLRIAGTGAILLALVLSVGTLRAQDASLLRTIDQIVFQPQRLAASDDGRILISETRRNRVRVLSDEGQLIRSYLVKRPLSVGWDAQDRVLIGHETRVDAFDENGTVVYSFGIGAGEFGKPSDLTVLPDGRIFVTDCPNHVVKVYGADGTEQGTIGVRGSESGEFMFPTGITFDPETSELYVADQGNARIQVFSMDGEFLRSFGTFTHEQSGEWVFEGTFSRVQGLAVDAAGRVYVADAYQNNVQILTSTGGYLGFIDLDEDGAHFFSLPLDLAVSGDKLFVASLANSEIKVFSLDGLSTGPGAASTTVPATYALEQNYPNPFNPSTRIRYSLSHSGWVKLSIWNLLGREVVSLVDDYRSPGDYATAWDGRSARGLMAASGVYFYQLKVTDGAGAIVFNKHRKMMLLK